MRLTMSPWASVEVLVRHSVLLLRSTWFPEEIFVDFRRVTTVPVRDGGRETRDFKIGNHRVQLAIERKIDPGDVLYELLVDGRLVKDMRQFIIDSLKDENLDSSADDSNPLIATVPSDDMKLPSVHVSCLAALEM
jgi:hypothetical protein